jgi:hypothetical protein
MKKYSLQELEQMKTIGEGHFDDLKVSTEDTRVWLSRMTINDGMPYNHQVTVSKLDKEYNWKIAEQYQAK